MAPFNCDEQENQVLSLQAFQMKKNSIDYFKCMSLKRIYPLGASLHYLVPGGIRISYRG